VWDGQVDGWDQGDHLNFDHRVGRTGRRLGSRRSSEFGRTARGA
jgi:hypothetical protein